MLNPDTRIITTHPNTDISTVTYAEKATVIPEEVHNREFLLIQTEIKKLYEDFETHKLELFQPVIELLSRRILSWFQTIPREAIEELSTKGIIEYDGKDLSCQFFCGLASLKKNQPELLVSQLLVYADAFKHLKSVNFKESDLLFLGEYSELFNCSIDLLNKPAYQFINSDYQYTLEDFFQISVDSYNLLLSSVNNLKQLTLFLISKISIVHSIFQSSPVVPMPLSPFGIIVKSRVLTTCQKKILCKVVLKISERLEPLINTQTKLHSLMFNGLHQYHIFSDAANQEGNKQISPHEFKPEVLYEFIKKVQEIKVEYTRYVEKIGDVCFFSRNIYLFFVKGDLKKLATRLKEDPIRSNRVETILLEELREFYLKSVTDESFSKKIEEFQSYPGFEALRCHRAFEDLRCKVSLAILKLTNASLDGPLKVMSQSLDEFTVLQRKNRGETVVKYSYKQLASPVTQEEEVEEGKENEEISESILDAEEKNEKLLQIHRPNKMLSISESLQKHRMSMRDHLKVLTCDSKSETQAAIKNAHGHLEDLFCTLFRFFNQPTISQQAFHSFARNCIAHGTLVVEQMLTALVNESNPKKLQEQFSCEKTRNYLSHDLYALLMNCQCKAGFIPSQIRSWIRKNNRGEIFSRDFTKCTGKSNIHHLLTQLRTKKSDEGSQQILQEIFTFLKPIGIIYDHLGMQIQASKGQQKGNSELHLIFQKIYSEGVSRIDSLKFAEESNPTEVSAAIQDTIQAIERKYFEDEFKFTNASENLLMHLKGEMQQQSNLHPIDAHLFLGNILYLNQLIAEDILLNLIPYDKPIDTTEHNLLTLVKALGCDIKDFTPSELNFLRRGKPLRQLVRYPENYRTGKKKTEAKLERLYRSAKQMSSKQEMSQLTDMSEGFKVTGRLQENLQKIRDFAQNDCEILSGILKLILKR